ncbi:ureidoglycolate lyase [Marinomonas arenicola]|uniref:ureidoglycolate lyase n=1 Tax=Marinomonas arenicola TaxID=569601 RepID=UPI00311E57A3
MRLIPEPLNAQVFAPFGEVIEASDAAPSFFINGGTTQRFHDLAAVTMMEEAEDSQGSRPVHAGISVFRGQARRFPMMITMLERHPKGSQAFMPLQGRPYFVVVAPPGENDEPDLSQLRLFYASGQQGVNYHQGTWHHPLLALGQTSDFLVVDRIGGGSNCDEYPFPDGQSYVIDTGK